MPLTSFGLRKEKLERLFVWTTVNNMKLIRITRNCRWEGQVLLILIIRLINYANSIVMAHELVQLIINLSFQSPQVTQSFAHPAVTCLDYYRPHQLSF